MENLAYSQKVFNFFPAIQLLPKRNERDGVSELPNIICEGEAKRKSHAADAINDEEKINDLIRKGYERGDFSMITCFILGINTGYRASDLWNIRVCDVFRPDGTVKDFYDINEQKTTKERKTYLNETAKKALMLLVHIRGKRYVCGKYSDYLFTADKRPDKWVYMDYSEYEKTHKKNDLIRSKEKFDPDGTERPQAPMRINDITRFMMKLAKEAGLNYHCSTHCMRQTYNFWRERIYGEFENSEQAKKMLEKSGKTNRSDYHEPTDYDRELATRDLNHSSGRTTAAHYEKKTKEQEQYDDEVIKSRQLALNLGKEAVDEMFEKFFGQEQKL